MPEGRVKTQFNNILNVAYIIEGQNQFVQTRNAPRFLYVEVEAALILTALTWGLRTDGATVTMLTLNV
jgi:hypothetical protein